jgi:hypothetical protein
MEKKVVKMEKILVKMEKMKRMEKILVILEKIIVWIPSSCGGSSISSSNPSASSFTVVRRAPALPYQGRIILYFFFI